MHSMKQKQKIIGFISGILISTLVFTSALPTVADSLNKMIEVFTGVKVYVDDIPIDAGDLNGNPEAFIYNGTTYIAARAVSNSLGENVLWDGTTKSVYVGKHAGSEQYLLDVCPPYQTRDYSTPSTITMAGTKYTNGFTLSCGLEKDYGYAYFNLNGKYNTLTFDVGHVDGKDMRKGTCDIYLDGKLAISLDLTPDMLPQPYTIPLNGALQMKLEMNCSTIGTAYGFVDAIVS